MKKILSIVICLTLSLVVFGQNQKTNIIFIIADDLGYGDIGINGQEKIETPNINRLAKLGVQFKQFYAGTAVCAPSRASLMTGLHTGHAPVRGNKGFQPEGQTPLPDSSVTFPMLLRKAGYTTAAFGKWGLGFITTSGDPQQKGFDEFYGYNCQTLAHNYYPDHLWQNHDRIDLSGNLKFDSVYSADLIHEQAMQFLKADHDNPFFLFLPYTLPHADVFVPHDSVYDHYVRKFNEKPVEIKSNDREAHHFDPYPHAAYAAMVARLDRYTGEIMKAVEEKGIARNTIIIFTSDNGPHRENGGDPEFFNSNGIYRGIKRDLYEGGIRVPFIAYQPGVTRPGTINNTPFAFWDLFNTFLDMAALPKAKNTDGFSILPAIRGQKQQTHPYLYWEFHESGGRQAVRMGNWKGVRLNVNKERYPVLELYDLQKDPAEKNNIAAKYPAIVQQIEKIMAEAHQHNGDWPLLVSEF
jgi:arylsulfatase A